MPTTVHGWRMTGPGRLERFERRAETPGPGRALVHVAGCGVCHTDLGYLYGGIPTKHPLPLVLGHEISGVVVEAGAGAEPFLDRRVLVPAVSPCGRCHACHSGRPTACRDSLMPGNDEDGGFASHVEVPASSLCQVDSPGARLSEDAPVGEVKLALWEIAVVADAVTTPFQAIRRCGLASGDLAVVVGAGGIGSYAVQLARAQGAVVAAIDVSEAKLERALTLGAAAVYDARRGIKEIRAALRDLAASQGAKPAGWRILETSGTTAGQDLAWSLLSPGGSISIVGFTPEPLKLRLSNLMAFDATAYGNWGCDPALYREALSQVASGAVQVKRLVRKEKLDDAPAVLEAAHHGAFVERIVLAP